MITKLRVALIISAILVLLAIACNIAALAVPTWVHWNNGNIRYGIFGHCITYTTGDKCYSYYDTTDQYDFVQPTMACAVVTLILSLIALILLIVCIIIILNRGVKFNIFLFIIVVFILAGCATAFAAFGIWVHRWLRVFRESSDKNYFDDYHFGPGTWLILATAILLVLALLVLVCFASFCDHGLYEKSADRDILVYQNAGYNDRSGVEMVTTGPVHDRYQDQIIVRETEMKPKELVVREGTTIAQDPEMESHLHATHLKAPLYVDTDKTVTTRTTDADRVVLVDQPINPPEAFKEVEVVGLPVNTETRLTKRVVDTRPMFNDRRIDDEARVIDVVEGRRVSEPVIRTNRVVTERHYTQDKPRLGEDRIVHERHVIDDPVISTNRVVTERHFTQDNPRVDEDRIVHERPMIDEPVIRTNRVVTERHFTHDKPRVDEGRVVDERYDIHDDDEWRLLDPEPIVAATEHHITQDQPIINERRIVEEHRVIETEPEIRSKVVTENQQTVEERRFLHKHNDNQPVVYEHHIIEDQPTTVVREEPSGYEHRTSFDRKIVYDEPPMVPERKRVYNHHMHMRDGTRDSELVIVAGPPRSVREDTTENRTVETQLVVTNKEGNRQVHPLSVHSIDRAKRGYTTRAYTNVDVCYL